MFLDWNVLGNLLGTYGFPIICCGALFWYVLKKDNDRKEETKELKAGFMELSKAINNNTIAMNELKNMLER